jgi:hypothetical protein
MECGFAIRDGRAAAEGRRRNEDSSLPALLEAYIVNIGGGGPFQGVMIAITLGCSVGFGKIDIENLRLVVGNRNFDLADAHV